MTVIVTAPILLPLPSGDIPQEVVQQLINHKRLDSKIISQSSRPYWRSHVASKSAEFVSGMGLKAMVTTALVYDRSSARGAL